METLRREHSEMRTRLFRFEQACQKLQQEKVEIRRQKIGVEEELARTATINKLKAFKQSRMPELTMMQPEM